MPHTPSSKAKIKIMLAGVGPHAKKSHLPYLSTYPHRLELVAAVEVPSEVEAAKAAVKSVNAAAEIVEVDPWFGPTMPARTADRLTEVAKRLEVDAIIVATEPLAHFAYLAWGIDVASVFVDKPIVLHPDCANDPAAARRLEGDVRGFVTEMELKPDSFVAVGTQRRYHPGLALMTNLVLDASARFQTPVTFMTSTHMDGQFRYPHEVESFRYHGYDQGYGKLGHSGFHIVSTQADLMQWSCVAAGVTPSSFTTTAAAVRPDGFLLQVPRAAYERRFGPKAWADVSPASHAELAKRMRSYGEMDVAITNTFSAGGIPIAIGQINLAHTSVSRRASLTANADLYKGNGRVKHEVHSVTVGPFMNVQLHSYQSRSNHDSVNDQERSLGGNDSMEVHVYRNAEWFEPRTPEFEIYTGDRIAALAGMPPGSSFTQHAKNLMLEDFFSVVGGATPASRHRSPLRSHLLGSSMLSAAYEAVATGDRVRRALASETFTAAL